MTTTSTNCGLTDDGKTSSRVLQPPGGGSSDIFGTNLGAAAPAARQQQRNGSSNPIVGNYEESPSRQKQDKGNTHSNIFGAQEPHVIAGKGRNQSKFNPITGEPYDEFGSPVVGASNSSPKTEPATSSPSVSGAAQSGQGDAVLQTDPGTTQAGVHTSSRVLNPPGGKTHQIW